MSDQSVSSQMMSPTEAWELLQADPSVTLIDVRSDMEFLMIGHPKGAVNVPLIDAPDWTVNAGFVANVRKALLGRLAAKNRQTNRVLLICRSGNRSQQSAELLHAQGLSDIAIIEGGFEGPLDEHHQRNTVAGWRFEGLPWEQC